MSDQTELAKIVHDTRNTAQAAQATLETAQEIAEAANTNPTNAELKEGLNEIRGEFKGHAAEDKKFQEGAAAFQDAQTDVNAKVVASLDALHKRFDDLGTKEDMKNLQTTIKNITLGVGIFKFSFNNAAKIGSFLIFIIAIGAFFKFGFAAFVAVVLGKH